MTDARLQAIDQRRNLLNIERELDAGIERMQKLKATTRKHIEEIEREYQLPSTGASFPLSGITVDSDGRAGIW